MTTPQWKFLIEGGSTGQVFTKIGGADGDYTWATPSGASPGGSDTQIQYNSSGVFAGSANLTYAVASSSLTILHPTNSQVIFAATGDVGDGTIQVAFGDNDANNNGTAFILYDNAPLIGFSCKGQILFGDYNSLGNGSAVIIDDPNQKTTSNVKHEASGDISFTDHARGLVLKDNAGTPHFWRVSVSTLGVLSTTDIGTSLP